jgi:hypothetical protein
MVMAKLHVICGNCGANDMFNWKIEPKGNCDNEGREYPDVYISCDNCATLHSLTSVIGEQKDRENANS